MLIINDTQIQEEGEIYERPYITRGIKRNCIEITIGKQDNVTYDTLVNTYYNNFHDLNILLHRLHKYREDILN